MFLFVFGVFEIFGHYLDTLLNPPNLAPLGGRVHNELYLFLFLYVIMFLSMLILTTWIASHLSISTLDRQAHLYLSFLLSFLAFCYIINIELVVENVAKTTKQIKQKESKLIEGLRKDAKLDKEMRNEFLSIATIFLENFSENINKTSLELNKEIPIGVDTWKDFLNYPIVRQYIQSFKDEQINLRADTELMQGNKDAVNIKKVMQNAGPAINNSNIVLIRLPEKVDM